MLFKHFYKHIDIIREFFEPLENLNHLVIRSPSKENLIGFKSRICKIHNIDDTKSQKRIPMEKNSFTMWFIMGLKISLMENGTKISSTITIRIS
jgi:hypothetical protein